MDKNRNFRISRIIFIYFAYGIFSCLQAQNTDSLINLLKNATDTVKVNLLNELTDVFYYQDIKQTEKFNLEALTLAKEIKFQKGEAKAINNLGMIFLKNGDYDSSLVLQAKALELYTRIRNNKGIAKVYGDMGMAYWRKSDYVTALDLELKSIKLYEVLNDLKGLANGYNMVGIIHKNMKKNDEALKYFLQSADYKMKMNDEKGLASSYQNIGNIYKNRLSEDTAMMYYNKALTIHRKYKNRSSEAMVISNMGSLMDKLKRYKEARDFYFQCLEIDKEVSDPNSLATTYLNIGNSSVFLKDYKTAEEYIARGMTILKELGDKEGIMSAYEMLTALYEQKKDYKKAFESYFYFTAYKDSIIGLKAQSELAEIQTKYEVEKKDLELAKNIAELEIKDKQAQIKNGIIFSISLLAILLGAVAYLFFNKKRMEQKAILDKEIADLKDMRTKSIIETEERERIRIAKDLHDGVGQLLSAAKMNLSSVKDQLQLTNPEQQTAFKNAVDLLDESVKEVRTVSHNMMPNILLKMGLASAVKEFITKIQNTPDLKVSLEVVGMNERLEPEKESILYRVIQEVISNIIKHADASELTLQLIRHETELSVIIEDNGVGFNPDKINEFEGIGLKNIISRVEFINGTVHFDSVPGRGTTVVVEVSLA